MFNWLRVLCLFHVTLKWGISCWPIHILTIYCLFDRNCILHFLSRLKTDSINVNKCLFLALVLMSQHVNLIFLACDLQGYVHQLFISRIIPRDAGCLLNLGNMPQLTNSARPCTANCSIFCNVQHHYCLTLHQQQNSLKLIFAFQINTLLP